MDEKIDLGNQAKKIDVSQPIESKEFKIHLTEKDLGVEGLNQMGVATIDAILANEDIAAISTCNTCKFWKTIKFRKSSNGTIFPTLGMCRINPPEVVVAPQGIGSQFPIIGPYDWCGKYEAMPDVNIEPVVISSP